jgi:xanthine dehydrogenase YagR molybdenum-binding subunit
MTQSIGRPVPRVDGIAKVTGGARYAADTPIPGMTYGSLVLSTIGRGTISAIDTSAAQASPGVLAVLTHLNSPGLMAKLFPNYSKTSVPLQDATVTHSGQIIAAVVATTLEQAQEAATLVNVRYSAQQAKATLADAIGDTYLPPPGYGGSNEFILGDTAAGLAAADVRIEAQFSQPNHHHNPIEPSATVVEWNGDHLTLHQSTQGVGGARRTASTAFGIPAANVRVLATYLGGGFGSKTSTWPHTLAAVMLSRVAEKPVKLVLTRAQMFTLSGHRGEFRQHLTLGAKRDGTLTAIVDITTQQLSRTSENVFSGSVSSRRLYACPNIHTRQQGIRLDMPTASYMRSPEMSSHFGLETALDELSVKLGIDPVELRIRNYTDTDTETGKKFTSKYLLDCYRMAGDAFGWSKRNPTVGSMRAGAELIGWGMATEAHGFSPSPSSASVRFSPDGSVLARSATHDIGTGTYTVMTQVTGAALGIPLGTIRFELADSDFPPATLSASSATVASVTGAVNKAALAVRDAVITLAIADPASPLHGLSADKIRTENGFLIATDGPSRRDSYRAVLGRHGQPIEVTSSSTNTDGYTTGAMFAEVRIDPLIGRIRVTRLVGAYDVGRVMNRQTARSQVLGGMTWGIGYALMEHTIVDRRTARIVNPTLSSYLVPVCADVPEIQALFVDKPDPGSEALGAKGFGECPITGVPAAIANAVYHATGKRVRDLPITQDKLL